jgi:hypothetical protein
MYEETTKHPKKEDYKPKRKQKKKKRKSDIPDNENIKEAIKENKEKQKTSKNDYRIYGVKKTQEFIKVDRELPRPLETMIEKGGGCLGIFSPPGSGKSNLLTNLILREEFLKDLFDGGLYLISPTIHSDLTAEKMIDYCDFVADEMTEELLSGIYQNIMSIPKEDRQLSCIIMDDCLGSRAMRQHTILNKMISSCRHMKTLFIFSLQAIKGLTPNLRSCMSHTISFYQPSNKQFNDLVELHSFFGGEEQFTKNYEEACNPKYGFIFNDWRDLKSYAWGAELSEPKLLWERYNEKGEISKNSNETDKTDEINKGKLKSDN